MATMGRTEFEGIATGLRDELRGEVILPEDAAYDEARTVWNAMIDRRPAAIVRCAGVADVIRAVEFARRSDRPIAVRGGGHNIAGNAVGDDAVVVDLSRMRSVQVDPEGRTARVEAGALLSDVDHETQAFGLATPLGINSTTGVAGLTLGGGFGWLSRRYGMTIDNLRAAQVVTATGELVTASESSSPDLFWGLRGGGGNFGVVTAFEFDLHPVGPEVFFGPIVFALDEAPHVLRRLREFNADLPDEAAVWAILREAPPLPFLDESVVGTDVLVLAGFSSLDVDEGAKLLAPLREFGDVLGDGMGPAPYAAVQQAFDPLLTPGMRNYWKTHNFADLSDGAIDTAVEHAKALPTPHSEIFFGHLGGAVNRVASDATAYPYRDVGYVMNVHTRWEDPAQDQSCIAWARDFHAAMAPHAAGGAYVNFISERTGEETDAYGDNYARLAALKSKYDPGNAFSVNQNVRPESTA